MGRNRRPRHELARRAAAPQEGREGGDCRLRPRGEENHRLLLLRPLVPPCRLFTPVLAEFYSELVGAGEPFEVVFVSSDKSAEELMAYMKRRGPADQEWAIR